MQTSLKIFAKVTRNNIAMHHTLQVCEQFAIDLDVKFNSNKSVVLRIGCRYNASCELWQLAREKLNSCFAEVLRYMR